MLSLVIACWLARNDAESNSTTVVVAGMLLYNVGVLATLICAGVDEGLAGIPLWPEAVAHALLAAWCIACLRT